MNLRNTTLRISIVVAALAIMIGCNQKRSNQATEKEPQVEVGENDKMSDTDIRDLIIKSMIDNRLQIALVELARSEEMGLNCKDFCDVLYDDHEEIQYDIAQIAKTYKVEIPEGLTPEAQQTYERLEKLPQDEFEEAFLDMIIRHHKADIKNYEEMMISEGEDLMERAMIDEIIKFHRNHLKMALEAKEDLTA